MQSFGRVIIPTHFDALLECIAECSSSNPPPPLHTHFLSLPLSLCLFSFSSSLTYCGESRNILKKAFVPNLPYPGRTKCNDS